MARDTYELEVDSNDRVGALGKTGSGKTFLMIRLITQLDGICIIIVDTKHAIQIPNFKVVYGTDIKGLKKALRHGKIIYRPGSRKAPKTKPDEALYRLIWSRFGSKRKADCLLYIDEMAHVTTPNTIPEGLRLLIQAGREVGIGVWWAGQQGTGVNNWAISQTERIFVFRLTSGSDRAKMEKYLTETVEDVGTLENTQFHAYGFPEVEGIVTEDGTEAYILYLDKKEDDGTAAAGTAARERSRGRESGERRGGPGASGEHGSSGI